MEDLPTARATSYKSFSKISKTNWEYLDQADFLWSLTDDERSMPARPDHHRYDDLFAEFGKVSLRRLFSGEGIYAGERIIGIVMDERIYLKTDAVTRRGFTAESCKPFYFRKDGKRIASSYYALPDRLYDDPAELAEWARKAFDVSTAKKAKRRPA
jgi:DNA transformation protein